MQSPLSKFDEGERKHETIDFGLKISSQKRDP